MSIGIVDTPASQVLSLVVASSGLEWASLPAQDGRPAVVRLWHGVKKSEKGGGQPGANGIFISGNPFGATGMQRLTISGSSVNENVVDGINTSGIESSLVITDSEISRNGDEGIEFNNAAAAVLTLGTLSVGDCRVEHNGGDGMLVTTAGGTVYWSAWQSTFAFNTGVAIDDVGLPMLNASCAGGLDLFAVNTGLGAANFNGVGALTCMVGNQVQ